jgi:hypothetical protein
VSSKPDTDGVTKSGDITPPFAIETFFGFPFKKKSLLIAYQIVDELVIVSRKFPCRHIRYLLQI